jgi:hypothetical protein
MRRRDAVSTTTINPFIEALQDNERSTFNTHKFFASNLLIRHACVNAGPSKCKELFAVAKELPEHVVDTFVQYLLVWMPNESWSDIVGLMRTTVAHWSPCPGPSHVAWQWLRVLILPLNLQTIRPKVFYETLGQFIELIAPRLNDLPTPAFSQDFHDDDRNFDHLTNIVQILTGVQGQPADAAINHVRRLNRVTCSNWSASTKVCVGDRALKLEAATLSANRNTMLTPSNAHWQVLEAAVLVMGASDARCMDFVHDIRLVAGLSPADRAFILVTALNALKTQLQESLPCLRSWGAIASVSIAELGLVASIFLRDSVHTALRSASPSAPQLKTFIIFFSAATEAGDTQDVVKVTKKKFSDWARELAIVVSNSRNLGPDREIDELIHCFGKSSVSGTNTFQPHLFSFDGTPVVTLPTNHLQQLREVIVEVERCEAVDGMLDAIQIKQLSQDRADLFLAEPAIQRLGQFICVVREGFFQATKKKPFRIQCMTLASFMLPLLAINAADAHRFKGRLGQAATGEGKSISVSMTALLFALMHRHVDVITSSQALARRDAEEFHELFQFFGISASTIAVQQPSRDDFNAMVLYGTNTDFEFAQLREGTYLRQLRMIDPHGNGSWLPRVPDVVIVDESDSLLLDAACNSARIACQNGASFTWIYSPIFRFIKELKESVPATLFSLSLQNGMLIPRLLAILREYEGGVYRSKLERISDRQLICWMNAANVALLRTRDIHYVVKQHRVVIVDYNNTGRFQESSRWSNGIHEMVEVKEGVEVEPESGTIASISHPSFFDEYRYLLAITGTAGEPQEREEIRQVYGIDTFDVPPHRPCLRKRLPTRIYRSRKEKFAAMVESVRGLCGTRSVLVLMPDITSSIDFSTLLSAAGIRHLVLNEQQQESEDLIIYKAGQVGSVTVATNTAGRGTDIKISKALLAALGLHVIFGGFPANLRVECQGLGRSARQGQPGSNQIFISVDEPFVIELLRSMTTSPPAFSPTGAMIPADQEKEFVQALYLARTANIVTVSSQRCRTTALERVRFATLQYFFADQAWFVHDGLVARNEACQLAYETVRGSKALLPLTSLCERLHEWFRVSWTIYFSKIASDEGAPLLTDEEINSVYQSTSINRELIEAKARKLYRQFLIDAAWPLTNQCFASTGESMSSCIIAILNTHGELASHLSLDQSPVLDAMQM